VRFYRINKLKEKTKLSNELRSKINFKSV